MLPSPLNGAECERLNEILLAFRNAHAMNLEAVDGFFAALICSPETVLPREYLPEIWGGEATEPTWKNEEELQDFLDLLMRHWNSIASTLASGGVYLPFLVEGADGVAHGNDWAQGFMRGMALHEENWRELFRDEDKFGMLLPILILFHEHDDDPEMRSYKEPVSAELREKLIVGAAASVTMVYRHFAASRRTSAQASTMTSSSCRRPEPKIGRNEPCPCGSGKKYKRCCGSSTIQ